MTIHLKGIGITRGTATGKAHILERDVIDVTEYAIPREFLKDEVNRFKAALRVATRQLKDIKKQIPAQTPTDISSFIDTHLLMMKDSALSNVPITMIKEHQCNAEWALKRQRDILVGIFDEMEDPYLRTRKDDVDYVVNRIQRVLLSTREPQAELKEKYLKGYIIIADDLSPADTVQMFHQGVSGFVTEYGGPTSHTAILARSLGIPTIVGLRNARNYIQEDEPLIIDGNNGLLVVDADESTDKYYRKLQRRERQHRAELAKLRDKPAKTLDGISISLLGNIELPEDINAIKRTGAEGVGLYRTEYLYMNRPDTPTEEEHFKAYMRVINAMKGAPVTIRTLDLGADKQVDGGVSDRPIGTNPALGLRAVRLCLKDPGLFLPQVRALLRSGAYGPLKIMIPMLSTISELYQIKDLFEQAKRELKQRRMKFNPDVPVGGMIEVPAAAIMAQNFAACLDFLSIGTNDLIQYTLAIDRIDDEVNYLYDPAHPAVLGLIQNVIQAGKKAGIPVSMCGEMAGDIRYTRLLLTLGLTQFSMHPATLLEVKKIINNSDIDKLRKAYMRPLKRGDHAEIQHQLELDSEAIQRLLETN